MSTAHTHGKLYEQVICGRWSQLVVPPGRSFPSYVEMCEPALCLCSCRPAFCKVNKPYI